MAERLIYTFMPLSGHQRVSQPSLQSYNVPSLYLRYCPHRNVWLTDGCEEVNVTNNTVVCECNHLTHFAILLSPNLNVSQQAHLCDTHKHVHYVYV